MNNRNTILFIVEGEKRDQRLVSELTRCFLRGKYKVQVITVAAAQNLYMLYEKLMEDDFDTDVVEVLREQNDKIREQLESVERKDISEVYMFFDYDIQENNISSNGDEALSEKALREMLDIFDNETENGKLYISYPMIEATYDYLDDMCEAYSGCFLGGEQMGNYKKLSGEDNPKASRHMEFQDWEMIINIFVLRIKCLLNEDSIDYSYYRDCVSPQSIFNVQNTIWDTRREVFVLSALPEFTSQLPMFINPQSI